ncbi:hypothetical protein HG536_0C02690 [Torulaspora globosa]|uniref:Uncharacterized protein n=1 Tax=Torulaspora globosa TaxID=48254 RepID=A0A7G3ZF14_9SACH|nr:uncharacterized protein HG536_0C02690 [Torulaspora globosa]QLL32100.1 hypothetical protein HG536_0C02690 [Torulaspora globosa]
MNLVVFSGGTATNSLTSCFSQLSVEQQCELTYVLPISDNGGSTSEILRVFGGPAIGDIRSRIVRVISDAQVARLLSYRLPNHRVKAKQEWNEILEGSHPIWKGLPAELKEICRAFFVNFQAELLKRTKVSNPFKFEKASIGNIFLTGARLFLGSLDASIELMMRLGRGDPKIHVAPCINSVHTHHIAALLANDEVITGQSQISHPSRPFMEKRANSVADLTRDRFLHLERSDGLTVEESEQDVGEEEEEYANPLYILPELKNSQLHFDKIDVNDKLPAPIKSLLYINPYGEEIKPTGNSRVISDIKKADMLVYSIGSLVTSLLPIAILGNIADVILDSKPLRKVLLLNSRYDRETSWLDGLGYVKLLVDSMSRAALKYRQTRNGHSISRIQRQWSEFVTDLVYLKDGEILIDEKEFASKGILCHGIDSDQLDNDGLARILQMIGNSR